MKKNITYREKLLELAKIYKISEIKDYIKNKKKLTTLQIEHILKKNRVPIPTEINKNILEIHSKKITKPFNNFGNALSEFLNLSFKFLKKCVFFVPLSILKLVRVIKKFILDLFLLIKKSTINILNKFYYFEVEEKKANRVVSGFVMAIFLLTFVVGGGKIVTLIYKTPDNSLVLEKNNITKSEKKKEIVKKPEKKEKIVKKPENKKEIVKKPEKKKEIVKKPEKKKEIVRELVLPDLNLKTDTVLSLFADVEYDLKKVRKEKLVKPIYFTQFPKDLDEITSIKLKKETFIKIILPLVVAENQKILDDRFKLNKLANKKMTTDKEKSWLRQKFKEYKVTGGKISELQKRMDIIPVSIAIAQAAKESGWGTSRFALEGNAIFGQWTWNGKGIEPLDRNKEQSHKILKFPILRASVKAYKNNLNTHKSYRQFREKRFVLRSRNKSIKGIKLIHTLDSYAQTGAEYTKTLAKMMDQNDLGDFENVKLTNHVNKSQLEL
jgi:Bax protein